MSIANISSRERSISNPHQTRSERTRQTLTPEQRRTERMVRARLDMAKRSVGIEERLKRLMAIGAAGAVALGAYGLNEERINPSGKASFTPNELVESADLGSGAVIRAESSGSSKKLAVIPEPITVETLDGIGWGFPEDDTYRNEAGRIVNRGWMTFSSEGLSNALKAQNEDGSLDAVIEGIEQDNDGLVFISGDLSYTQSKDGSVATNLVTPYNPEDYQRP